jgi:glutamyl endopeptidase
MTKPTRTKSVSGHTRVTNVPDEMQDVKIDHDVTEAPSKGQGASKAVAGETEAVGEHRKTETALARRFTAPATTALRDIAEASYGRGPDLQETVHGPDDRVQISNTQDYPWRASASLLITAADNSLWLGTGWFIGPHTLATAGHVVYITNSGAPGRDGWVQSIQVMPGRNGSSLPYGSVTSTNFGSVTGWTGSGDPNFDYGAIILPTDLGATTGWFGFGVYPDDVLLASTVNIAGYPGDKPAGTEWYDHHQIASVDARKVYYDIDTAGGQSGSAVYRIVNGDRYGVAIHAYSGAVTNSGTRIVQDVFDNLTAWKA